MIDRHTDHRAEAELMLTEAHAWAEVSGEPTSESNELSYLGYATVHALFAIHDTLTAADRYAANEAKQREAEPDPLDEDDHRDRLDSAGDIWQRVHERCWMEPGYPPVSHGPAECLQLAGLPGPLTFAPEAAQEANPDPLDEDDHRDRFDRDGMRLVRVGPHHWHPSSGEPCGNGCTRLSLASWNNSFGPLTFTPETPEPAERMPRSEPDPLDENDHRDRNDRDGDTWLHNPGGCFHTDTFRDDCDDPYCQWTLTYLNERYGPLTFTPEGEAEETQEPLLCPECDDHINIHNMEGCRRHRCDCPRTPEDVARPLIEQAVNTERAQLTAWLTLMDPPPAPAPSWRQPRSNR